MKRIFFIVLGAALSIGTYAQDGNNICAWNAMNTFNSGGSRSDLESGMKCSDDASVHEVTAPKSKTWLYRGQLYSLVFQDSVLRAKYSTSGVEAAKAFIKLNDLKDPKFRDWEDATNVITGLTINLYNQGADYFADKNYAQAADLFSYTKQLNTVLDAHKGRIALPTDGLLRNIATAYDNGQNYNAAVEAMEELYKRNTDSMNFLSYLIYLNKKAGKTDRAFELLDAGLAKQPSNAQLLSEKINVFLAKGDVLGALTFVNNLIAVDPKNDQAYVIKGLAFDSLGKSETLMAANKITKDGVLDSMVTAYKTAITINPNNGTANNNLGCIYIDKANALIAKGNKLGNSAAENKLYDELQVQIKKYYEEGFPFIEKAFQLEPNNAKIKASYNQIKIKLGK